QKSVSSTARMTMSALKKNSSKSEAGELGGTRKKKKVAQSKSPTLLAYSRTSRLVDKKGSLPTQMRFRLHSTSAPTAAGARDTTSSRSMRRASVFPVVPPSGDMTIS